MACLSNIATPDASEHASIAQSIVWKARAAYRDSANQSSERSNGVRINYWRRLFNQA